MIRRPVPNASVPAKEVSARNKAWNAANPALRAENLRRAEERDQAYREQYGLPTPRWEKPVQFTRLRGGLVEDDDSYLEAAE